MPFVPHTETDIKEMLDVIGAPTIDALFDEIPEHLRCASLEAIPTAASEMEITRVMHERASADGTALNFIGAGAYEHHIPAAVWEITTRGEFYSAYTPYQAEASQGTLQLLYEYQTMMCELTGMEISNASMYDGASALAEALLMAVRASGRDATGQVLVPRALHPFYRQVAGNLTSAQGISLTEIDFDAASGATPCKAFSEAGVDKPTAVVISQPNFFGTLEDIDAITDWAHEQGALVVAVVNPTLLAVHRPPSDWGAAGADIVVGEGQPLGAPLSSGGPYFGFLCCRKQYVRQMPGRIAGRTTDLDGNIGYTLTLQAREQHIRRSKATSNICTNQGLLVTAATIYMSLLGPEGLARVARASMANTRSLGDALCALPGVRRAFTGPVFHETLLQLDRPAAPLLEQLSARGIVGGLDVSAFYPELGHALLVCATETRTPADIQQYADTLRDVLKKAKAA